MTRNCWKKNTDSKVTKQMSTRKTPGSDAILAEVYKAAGPALLDKRSILFQPMWEKCSSLRTSRMQQPSISTNAGITSPVATTYCRVSLLVIARVLLNCLLHHLEQVLLPESLCGSCTDWGKVHGPTPRSLHRLHDQGLVRAFGTVSRERLWRIMSKIGSPDKFIAIAH